jgi:sigma-B regulation protein RsbU (phosphoserine phosphatase)
MSNFSDIKKGLSNIEALERELNLKQLQVNRLLNITQAINNNVSAHGLFDMYNSFLSWEIGVKKMALYVRNGEEWLCATSIGIKPELLMIDISDCFPKFERLKNLEDYSDHRLIQLFDVVIPVSHKSQPIAYVFIGGFGEDDDMYSKIQFITTITNIIAVAIENKRLFKRQLEQERLRKEVELASEVQKMLIPKTLPSTDAYELASKYKPHLGVGGDYFDFIEFNDGKIVFCVGDISGKGIAAALLMANFQANFHTLINKRAELDEFVRALNTSVNLITQGERFITFFIAQYDINTRRLKYVNAGHNPPILVMQGEVHFLNKGCTILGSFQELPKVEIGSMDVNWDALILAYTDGLTDITNEEGAFIDEQSIYDFAKANYRLSAEAFNENLLKQVEAYKGDQPYPDDTTLLTCRIFD